MSESIERPFRPWGFIAGILLGLVFCAGVGRWVSAHDYHGNFTRFHVRISPEGRYYPTMEEMRTIVRARCRPDQILVIVGGNSIFHGVGQPPAKLWTEELQRLLGPRYVVINFALRGALCTDGGAYVAESLRKEFPRQIYVANTSPFTAPKPYGIEPYRYLFWQARARGLLEDFPAREQLVAKFMRIEYSWGDRFERWGAEWLDRGLRFRDTWNWFNYRFFFTIPDPLTPSGPQSTLARGAFKDLEGDFDAVPLHERFKAVSREAEMAIVRGFSSTHVEAVPGQGWIVKAQSRAEFVEAAKAAVPDDLKARTLIMLSRNCPYYLDQLSPEERQREDFAYREAVAAWRALGYRARDYGSDYAPADFGDRTHLASSGGRKLARTVAAEINSMVVDLGYTTGKEVAR